MVVFTHVTHAWAFWDNKYMVKYKGNRNYVFLSYGWVKAICFIDEYSKLNIFGMTGTFFYQSDCGPNLKRIRIMVVELWPYSNIQNSRS